MKGVVVGLLLLVASMPAQAATKTIGSVDADSLRVLVVESSSGLSVALRATKKLLPSDAQIQQLQNPNRLVIDLPVRPTTKDTKALNLSHPLISGVRIGAHPNKTRVVLDLSEEFSQTASISAVDSVGALLVHLDRSNPQTRTQQQNQTVKKELNTGTSPAEGVESKNKRSPNVASQHTNSRFHTRAKLARAGAYLSPKGIIVHRGEKQKASKQERSVRITSLQFRSGEETALDSLVAEIDTQSSYSLTPVAPNRYELRIKDAQMDAAIPSTLGLGFASLSVLDDAIDTVLHIEVKPGVSIAAHYSANTLTLSATKK